MLNLLVMLYFFLRHFLGFSLVRKVENVVHLLDLLDFASIFKFLQQLEKDFLVKEDPSAPASRVLGHMLLPSRLDLGNVDRYCVVDQHLLHSIEFINDALNPELPCAFHFLVGTWLEVG